MRRRAACRWAFLCSGLIACGAAEPDVRVSEPSPSPALEEHGSEPTAERAWPKEAYRKAVDAALETVLSADPVRASERGDHRFDALWPDISEPGEEHIAELCRQHAVALHSFADHVPVDLPGAEVPEVGTDHPAVDAAVLADYLEAIAYERSVLRRYSTDPSAVVELIGKGITSLTAHDYAPLHSRATSLVARLGAVPELVKVARSRLKRLSRAGYENMTITETGLARALRNEVGKQDLHALGDDQALLDRLRETAGSAASALDAYATDVKKSFPRAALDAPPIGGEAWATLARLKEGVLESPGKVREMGESELSRLTRELDDLMDASPLAASVARSPHGPQDRAAFIRLLASNPLPDDKILPQYRYVNAGVEQWLKAHRFVSVPWDRAKLTIVQSSPQQRGVSFASMDEAGPLETSASDARFEVNIPDPAMSSIQRDALRAFHSLGAIDLVSIHEAIPGHYLQGLHNRESVSRVRKVIWASTTGEGWAHYCEQAMLDAGYTGDDRERVRAFYVRMALQRAVRVIVDVGENDGSLTMEQGAKLLEERALLPAEAARMEARRALVQPANMFTYTYGKLSILRMRAAIAAREKERFDLVHFHDTLLSMGAIPIRYVRKAAFGLDDSSGL
jgi:hypothetical protein